MEWNLSGRKIIPLDLPQSNLRREDWWSLRIMSVGETNPFSDWTLFLSVWPPPFSEWAALEVWDPLEYVTPCSNPKAQDFSSVEHGWTN